MGHTDRNIDSEIQWQKAIDKELSCVFIRVNLDKESFNIFKAVNEIHRRIKKSTEKHLINKISKISNY